MSEYTIIFQGKVTCCGAMGAWCRNTKYLITDQFIEKEVGVCCPSVDNLQVVRIQDLSYKDDCCCCKSCATITIFSSDETDPQLELKGIPNAKEVFQQIRNAVDKVHSGAKLQLNA